MILQSASVLAEWQWTCQTIDSTGRVGKFSNILEGNDSNFHISHSSPEVWGGLKYCEGTGVDWTCQSVDGTTSAGNAASMAFGSDNNVHISHRDAANNDLEYCEGVGDEWTCQTLDSTGSVGWFSSITEGSDSNLHISYYDDTGGDLKYCEGAAADWTCRAIDTTNEIGWYTSILEGGDNNFHIANYSNTDGDLRYCEGIDEVWTCQTIESTNQIGIDLSMVEGADGNLHISHLDTTGDDLRYCEGAGVEWTCQAIDTANNVGEYTSIVEGSDSNLHISHFDTTGDDLRYCEGAGVNWTCQTVDSTNDVGMYSSITQGNDGNLYISNYDNTNDDLRYCEGLLNTPPDANITTVDGFSDGTPQLFSYVADANLTVRFYAYDAEGNDLNFNMWYGTSQSAKTTAIVEDLNLSSAICDSDTNSVLGTYCEWDWSILDLANGNYFITIEVSDGSLSDTNSTEYVDGIQIHIASPAPGGVTPASCGDDSCDFASRGETAVNCPADCPAVCGDTACTHTESPQTCALDCIGCGDGKCGEAEDCLTCETDCGACEAQEPPAEPPVENPVEPGVGEPSSGGTNGNGVQEQPIECMIDSDCSNNNPCTTKTCVGTLCHTVPKADGSSCGFAKECVNVVCTQMSIIPTIQDIDPTTQVAVVAAAALIIGTAYIYLHSIV
ncbi:MAG: hypothetical protein QGI60_02285 [archaeon]|nr:hypothetical protein [archaeon]